MDQQFLLAKKYPSSQKTRLFNVLLSSSLLFNVVLLLLLLLLGKHYQLPKDGGAIDSLQGVAAGWSRKAAAEAESAAKYHCSGHGYVFVDTSLSLNSDEDGTPACECNDCYTGTDCSQFVPDCVANAESGDPVFLEPFWIANAEAAATVVPAWYRMGYRIMDGLEKMVSPELEKQIRAIHSLAGNAVTEGRYIVLGTGSMQLINAAVNSLSPIHAQNPNPAGVVSAMPFYGAYKDQTEMFESLDFSWNGDANAWIKRAESLNSTTFIEFVTSPNNPDAMIREAVLNGRNVKTVYDHAYYWPHFTAITRPADEDVMLFTLSKLTGHAGSRLGWAIVKDYDVYLKMYQYVLVNTLGVSHDTQLRATRLLKVALSAYEKGKRMPTGRLEDQKQLLFHYGYGVMRRRWQRLQRIFRGSDRYSLQGLRPAYCTFFKTVTGPSPAYAWVKCEREEDGDCAAVLKSGGIIGRGAESFGADKRYVRLSLLKRDDNFAILESRLQALISHNFSAAS
uniref:TSA: Wollemia nobilis Ref_Wollemi_Transcript_5768_2085 transcribed RNA sequence n=1 Tax=Wollemia nobilis TaxID=56998 RepID=A0A0C9RPC3_9CONI